MYSCLRTKPSVRTLHREKRILKFQSVTNKPLRCDEFAGLGLCMSTCVCLKTELRVGQDNGAATWLPPCQSVLIMHSACLSPYSALLPLLFHASLCLTKLWGVAHVSQREDMAESSVKNLSKTEGPDSAKAAL